MIITKARTRTTQPQGDIRLNPTSRFYKNITECYLEGVSKNLAGPNFYTSNNPATANSSGRATNVLSTGVMGGLRPLNFINEGTVVFVGSANADGALIGDTTASSYLLGFSSYWGTITFEPAYSNSGTSTVGSGPTFATSGLLSAVLPNFNGLHTIVATFSNTPSMGIWRIYVDGVLLADRLGQTVVTGSGFNSPIFCGGKYGSPFSGAINNLTLINRFIDDNEARSLSTNPWQLFKSPARIIPLSAAAGPAVLAGNAQAIAAATGNVSQTLTLSGAGIAISTASGVINQSINLAGSAASVSIANGIITMALTLAGSGVGQASASAAITQKISLGGAATGSATAISSFAGSAVSMAGSATGQASATGAINLTSTLSGTALANALGAASISSQLVLAGAATGQATASSTINPGTPGLGGNAQGVATAVGAIATTLPISGAAPITVTASGGVTSTLPLGGVAVSVASGTGNITIGVGGLTGNALAQVLAGGSITMKISLSATALSQAIANAMLTVPGMYVLPQGIYSLRSLSVNHAIKSLTTIRSIRSLTNVH